MKIFFMVLFLSFICIFQVNANEAERNDTTFIVGQVFQDLSVDHINQFIVSMNKELAEDIPLLNLATVKELISKGLSFDFQAVVQLVAKRIFAEMLTNMHLIGKLLFLAVLSAMLQNLQNAFEKSSIAILTYSVCFAFLSVIALTAFYNILKIASTAIDHMVSFMEALLPLLITLLAGMGSVTTAALFTPLMLLLISVVSIIVKNIVLPFLLISAALTCVNYLTEKYQLQHLTSIFKQSSMIILGFTMMIFIGVITIQGVAGSIADGITLRTAKFATATFVPVVGKVFADTVELVMGASLLLKNSIGIFGVIAIGTICLLPMIKISSLAFIMKFAGALIEPMGDYKLAKCLTSMGDHLLLVAGALLTVILMFFLAITMIIGASSMSLMLR
ncbi:MAG: stage sporulation protein [Massilibacillus sp.]|jgi:stage III sporulation protein AE|nr:stage sporulation protein [Massilibacillus sp.]